MTCGKNLDVIHNIIRNKKIPVNDFKAIHFNLELRITKNRSECRFYACDLIFKWSMDKSITFVSYFRYILFSFMSRLDYLTFCLFFLLNRLYFFYFYYWIFLITDNLFLFLFLFLQLFICHEGKSCELFFRDDVRLRCWYISIEILIKGIIFQCWNFFHSHARFSCFVSSTLWMLDLWYLPKISTIKKWFLILFFLNFCFFSLIIFLKSCIKELYCRTFILIYRRKLLFSWFS